jgi:hypothetical protein
VKGERKAVALVMTPWKHHAWRWPVTVTLTRVAPRQLDAEDNLTAALKAVRDEVAAQLGVDDRDARVTWRYGQERGGAREHAVRIEVVEDGERSEREAQVVRELEGMLGVASCPECGESLAVPHRRECGVRAGA